MRELHVITLAPYVSVYVSAGVSVISLALWRKRLTVQEESITTHLLLLPAAPGTGLMTWKEVI